MRSWNWILGIGLSIVSVASANQPERPKADLTTLETSVLNDPLTKEGSEVSLMLRGTTGKATEFGTFSNTVHGYDGSSNQKSCGLGLTLQKTDTGFRFVVETFADRR